MEDILLVFAYNILFFVLFVIWWRFLWRTSKDISETAEKLKEIITSKRVLITSVLIFLIVLTVVAQIFVFAPNTDVDDAITTGVKAFLQGINPYASDVVTHYVNEQKILGPYQYFPFDLLIYSFFYILGGTILESYLSTFWFLPFHVLLLIPYVYLFQKILDKQLATFNISRTTSISLAILTATPFLWSNAFLMSFSFLLGYYLIHTKKQKTLGLISYLVGAASKYMTGMLFFNYLSCEIRNLLSRKITIRQFVRTLIPFISSSVIFLIFVIPFGIWNVLVSTFLYQGEINARSEVAQIKGPILVEIFKALDLLSVYLPIFLLLTILFVSFIMIKVSNHLDQFIAISFYFMFTLPFYGTELFGAPLLAIIIRFFEIYSQWSVKNVINRSH